MLIVARVAQMKQQIYVFDSVEQPICWNVCLGLRDDIRRQLTCLRRYHALENISPQGTASKQML